MRQICRRNRSRFSLLVYAAAGFAFLAGFSSCGEKARKSTKYPGYYETDEGVHYKIHIVGESGVKPAENDWLELQMVNTVNDSVLFDSELDNARGTLFMPCSGNKYFSVLSEGDSATFILPAGGIFEYAYDSASQLMRMNVKVVRVLAEAAAQQAMQEAPKDPELAEQKMLAVFLRKRKLEAKPDANGLYFFSLKEGHGEKLEAGQPVTIRYSGRFLNGQAFDSPSGPLEFNWGAEKQVLRGLELALARMKTGGEAMIVLPSQLAFGSEGSGDGRVKPFTPVLYYLQIVDNKQ